MFYADWKLIWLIYVRDLALDQFDGIVIKFIEGSGVRIVGSSLKSKQAIKLSAKLDKKFTDWVDFDEKLKKAEKIIGNFKLKNLTPLFETSSVENEELKLKGEKNSGHELADLNLYFHLSLPKDFDQSQLSVLLQELASNEAIEVAYANPIPSVPVISEPSVQSTTSTTTSTPDLEDEQTYLLPASQGGIDAYYAWSLGATGSGVKVVDLENSWNLNQEDISPQFYSNGTLLNELDSINHGTAVLGVIDAQNNSYGVTGISYDATTGVEGLDSKTNMSSRILRASNAVGSGGVIIIEAHASSGLYVSCSCNQPQCGYAPMEYWQANFDAIQTAVANGVTVIEAGGNGSLNLDDSQFNNLFDRNVRDSGAILVGASSSSSRTPMCWTNYGSRIDMHGWGQNVVTTGYGDRYNNGYDVKYTDSFSGTSSASPIVAGAAANILSFANSQNVSMDPAGLRQLMVSTGTPQSGGTKNIGPLPDLKQALDSMTSGLVTPTASAHSYACYGENRVSWGIVPEATFYQVFISPSQTLVPQSPNYTTTSTSKFVDVSQTSYAWVKACNDSECSDYSNQVNLKYFNMCY